MSSDNKEQPTTTTNTTQKQSFRQLLELAGIKVPPGMLMFLNCTLSFPELIISHVRQLRVWHSLPMSHGEQRREQVIHFYDLLKRQVVTTSEFMDPNRKMKFRQYSNIPIMLQSLDIRETMNPDDLVAFELVIENPEYGEHSGRRGLMKHGTATLTLGELVSGIRGQETLQTSWTKMMTLKTVPVRGPFDGQPTATLTISLVTDLGGSFGNQDILPALRERVQLVRKDVPMSGQQMSTDEIQKAVIKGIIEHSVEEYKELQKQYPLTLEELKGFLSLYYVGSVATHPTTSFFRGNREFISEFLDPKVFENLFEIAMKNFFIVTSLPQRDLRTLLKHIKSLPSGTPLTYKGIHEALFSHDEPAEQQEERWELLMATVCIILMMAMVLASEALPYIGDQTIIPPVSMSELDKETLEIYLKKHVKPIESYNKALRLLDQDCEDSAILIHDLFLMFVSYSPGHSEHPSRPMCSLFSRVAAHFVVFGVDGSVTASRPTVKKDTTKEGGKKPKVFTLRPYLRYDTDEFQQPQKHKIQIGGHMYGVALSWARVKECFERYHGMQQVEELGLRHPYMESLAGDIRQQDESIMENKFRRFFDDAQTCPAFVLEGTGPSFVVMGSFYNMLGTKVRLSVRQKLRKAQLYAVYSMKFLGVLVHTSPFLQLCPDLAPMIVNEDVTTSLEDTSVASDFYRTAVQMFTGMNLFSESKQPLLDTPTKIQLVNRGTISSQKSHEEESSSSEKQTESLRNASLMVLDSFSEDGYMGNVPLNAFPPDPFSGHVHEHHGWALGTLTKTLASHSSDIGFILRDAMTEEQSRQCARLLELEPPIVIPELPSEEQRFQNSSEIDFEQLLHMAHSSEASPYIVVQFQMSPRVFSNVKWRKCFQEQVDRWRSEDSKEHEMLRRKKIESVVAWEMSMEPITHRVRRTMIRVILKLTEPLDRLINSDLQASGEVMMGEEK